MVKDQRNKFGFTQMAESMNGLVKNQRILLSLSNTLMTRRYDSSRSIHSGSGLPPGTLVRGARRN
jgi:hypothetical protein